jgi:urate oxidase
MSAVLVHDTYGKSRVRLTKVTRHAGRHDLKELCVAVRLEGDLQASYTQGDNRWVVATDTMKNIVYAKALDHPLHDPESFGLALAGHFLQSYAHVTLAEIELAEQIWQRIVLDGKPHPHAFSGGGGERRTCQVTRTRQGPRIQSGLDGLLLLKTTDSAFAGFLRDQYTTLPETDDRVLATLLRADWVYRAEGPDWNRCHELIRRTLVEVFAEHQSLSVQQTLYTMGSAALDACDAITEITLTMPNKHHLLVNLHPFGLANPNAIFVPTDEPHGLITGTLRRA